MIVDPFYHDANFHAVTKPQTSNLISLDNVLHNDSPNCLHLMRIRKLNRNGKSCIEITLLFLHEMANGLRHIFDFRILTFWKEARSFYVFLAY